MFLPQPPGNGNRLPEVFCILSSLGSWQFYGELLNKLEQKRRVDLEKVIELIKVAYSRPLPQPGMEAWIRSMVGGALHTIVLMFQDFFHLLIIPSLFVHV